MTDLITPAPLKPGDKIAICSPAGIIKPQYVHGAIRILQEMGWDAQVGEHAFSRFGTYAGTDQERYADLEKALLDPEIKAIMCSRGGYGVVHILDKLDKLPLRDNAKWVIGFSDISALHALMSKHGIVSIHSHMTSHLSNTNGEDDDSQALFDILQGKPVSYKFLPHHLNRKGKATGTLLGGNLSVIADLIGTPFDIIKPDTILFLEDVSEPVYKIERIMYQLRLSGVMERLKGLIIGKFTDYSPDADNASMEEMINKIIEPFGFPVAYGAPIGHVNHNIPLKVSAPATLTVDEDIVTVEQ